MRLRIRFALGFAACGLASLASAQVPAGGEFRVNTYTTQSQEVGQGSVALASGGSFVVVWDTGMTITDWNVAGQRFDPSGTPQGAEFTPNLPPWDIHDQRGAAVAMVDSAGTFVTVWESRYEDGDGYGVFGRYYTANGAPAGGEFRVNATTQSDQWQPAIASDGNRSFVVVWKGQTGIVGSRFDRTGVPVEFQVNSATTGLKDHPAVEYDGAGGFVVVWRSVYGFPGSTYGIFGQRFDPSGQRRGAEFTVKDYGIATQNWPDVAVAADGAFVVTWEQFTVGGGVFARRYDASNNPLGTEFRVGTATNASSSPTVDSDDLGNFVVAWVSGEDAWIKRFDAQGAPLAPEFRVNTYTTGSQFRTNIAVDRVGNAVVAWHSYLQDGDSSGVYAQRFGGLLPAALRVDTGGNGILEPGENAVPVRPSWTNVNGAAQAVTGQVANPLGPPGGAPVIGLGQAVYGTVGNGLTAECSSCYTVSIPAPAPRPATHWDASVDERILPIGLGQHKRWTLHVGESFTDVPRANPFYRFVETLLHRGVTGGCSPTSYCPGASATREQMAVFVLAAKEGARYVPPACGATPMFADVPASSPFCRWIEELARRGIVSGCGGGNYCPGTLVARDQMAVFTLRTLDPVFNPPACGATPMFADVPASSPFCRWVEELARRGIVSGCGGGNYCPGNGVTREQMGVFISATFGLALYGP